MTLAIHAGRMHKLCGSAGLLGAKAVLQLAGEAEAACVAGNASQASQLARKIASQLQRLRRVVEPVFRDGSGHVGPAATSDDGVPEPQSFAELITLLRLQSLAAMDCFSTVSPQLQRLLGKELFELIGGHIDDLRFGDAADALEAGLWPDAGSFTGRER
jgi:HPt (histidine-containing phosphotransfer) domain-containing protein